MRRHPSTDGEVPERICVRSDSILRNQNCNGIIAAIFVKPLPTPRVARAVAMFKSAAIPAPGMRRPLNRMRRFDTIGIAGSALQKDSAVGNHESELKGYTSREIAGALPSSAGTAGHGQAVLAR